MSAAPFTAATDASTTSTLDGDNDGSDNSMSETSENAASTIADDMSSHYERASYNLEKKKHVNIAETEERHVRVIRVVTFGFIIFSAITVCAIVYLFAKDYDKHDFELDVSSYKVILTISNHSQPGLLGLPF